MTRHFGFPGDSDDADLPLVFVDDHWEVVTPEVSRLGWQWEAALVVGLGLIATLGVYAFIFFFQY
jgi:hypothetical protein